VETIAQRRPPSVTVIDLKASETAIELLIAYGDCAVARARELGQRAAEIGTPEEVDHWLAVYLLLEKARRIEQRASQPGPPMPNGIAAG